MIIRACMGGMCGRREACPHYVSPTNTVNPAERLCDPGRDAVVDGRWLRFMRDASPTEQTFPSQVLQ